MQPFQCLRENADVEAILQLRIALAKERERIGRAAEAFALIGNDTRLSILWLIEQANDKQLCPCDLADVLGITVPAVSQQLQRLRQGRLLTNRREGKTIYYVLTDEGRDVLRLVEKRFGKEESHG